MAPLPPGAPGSSIASRGLISIGWTTFAGLATLPISFLQTIFLARLLPVDVFGVYGGIAALISISITPVEFGLGAAAMHRAPETDDEQQTMAVLFTIRVILATIWAIGMAVFGWLALTGIRQQMLIILVVFTWALHLALTGQVLLVRRVQHRRLAIIDIVQSILVFLAAVGIAVVYRSIWALAVAPAVQALVNLIGLAVVRPVWRPRLAWNWSVVRYFLDFGRRTVGGLTIAVVLDRLDDLWTNVFLGDTALGYYSRAYRFASYPRVILAEPLNTVSAGVYAELKHDRLRLSKAFFRVNALLVRSGFFLAGWLSLVAPHLIVVILGERWLPMLAAFRWMLLYTLLDPIKLTIANVIITSGRPEWVSQVRMAQLIVLISGLSLLGIPYGIVGVAIAVNLMLLAGVIPLLILARRFVDFSPQRLFGAPVSALAAALLAGSFIGRLNWFGRSDGFALIGLSLAFGMVYLGVLVAIEYRFLADALNWIITRREEL